MYCNERPGFPQETKQIYEICHDHWDPEGVDVVQIPKETAMLHMSLQLYNCTVTSLAVLETSSVMCTLCTKAISVVCILPHIWTSFGPLLSLTQIIVPLIIIFD